MENKISHIYNLIASLEIIQLSRVPRFTQTLLLSTKVYSDEAHKLFEA